MATKRKQASPHNESSEPERAPKLDKPRKDEVGRSGVYPFTSSQSPKSAQIRTAGSWGQGERGARGYEDQGGSGLSYEGGQLLGALEEGGDSLAAHPQSGDIEIPPEEWISFFDSFSRQHEGWLASVKVIEGSEQKWEVKERKLAGISSDHLTSRDEIYISIDRDEGGQLTHPIKNPMKVVFRRDLNGAHEGIDIISADGTTTSIWFRIASRPETLDGVVDFQHRIASRTKKSSRRNSGSSGNLAEVREVQIPIERIILQGRLSIPEQARGIVVFAHGSGSSRHSPRNRFVAGWLQNAGYATLLMDLLTSKEEVLDERTATLRFDIGLLARRLIGATRWLQDRFDTASLPVGYFGTSTGAAAALVAAAEMTDLVAAVVSRGGRPDLAGDALHKVISPTLLIVGGIDTQVIELNRKAFALIPTEKELEIVPGASHLFEEPGTLELVAKLAKNWFDIYLSQSGQRRQAA